MVKSWQDVARTTRQESDLETMKELINTIVQKTGISQEDAQKTVQVVLGFLKTKMPAPFAAQLDSFLSGSGLPQQTGFVGESARQVSTEKTGPSPLAEVGE